MRATEDFAALPLLEDPAISPDGTRIAGRVAAQGRLYFGILSLDSDQPALVPLGNNDLNWWRWVNKDWLVIGYGAAVPGPDDAEDWYVTRAAGVRADGKKIVPLAKDAAQDGDDIIWVAHDGSPRILLSAQHSVYSNNVNFWPNVMEYDVSTGKGRTVLPSRETIMNWVADSSGVVRMGSGTSLSGRDVRVLYRGDARSDFREIVHQKRSDDNDYVLPALFLPEAGKALAYADDAQGYGGIFEYDLARLALGKQLYGSKGFDIGSMIRNQTGDALAGIRYLEAGPRTEWLDPDLAKLQSEVDDHIEGARGTLLSYSDDRKRAIVLVSGADSPGAYFLYDRPSGDMRMLALRNQAIKMARLNPVKTVKYKARDGLEISAVLTVPRGRPAKALPLIVMPHGGPAARDDESWDWWAQFLAERGYAVVQPNYRGSTGYGTPFHEKGEGEWGLKMQDDLDDAVAWLASQGIADAKRTCIVGASYGGYAALRAAQRGGGIYRCAVSYAGVSDLGAMKRYDGRFLGGQARGDWLKKQAPDFRSVSPLFAAADFSIPVLIVHGKEDRTVPYSQSKSMADRLEDAGKPVVFITQPQADHHFTRGEDRLEFLKALEKFLAEHNPA